MRKLERLLTSLEGYNRVVEDVADEKIRKQRKLLKEAVAPLEAAGSFLKLPVSNDLVDRIKEELRR